MIYFSISRLLIYTLFFSVVGGELKGFKRERITVRINAGAFAVLALGEAILLVFSLIQKADFSQFPVRNFFEIAALLIISFSCNHEVNRHNPKHFKTIKVYYCLTLIVPVVLFFIFSRDVSKFILYGLEVVLFSKILINISDKIDETIEKKELIVVAFSLLFFIVDLFLRLLDGYQGFLLAFAITGFCIGFLTYVVRETKRDIEREISTKEKEIKIFADITKKLNATFDLKQLLDNFVEEICETLDAYSGALFLEKKSDGILVCEALHGFYPPLKPVNERAVTKLEFLHKLLKAHSINKDMGIIGRVFKAGKGELSCALDTSKTFVQTIPTISLTKTMITMPLLRDETVYGVLQLVNKNNGENFTEKNYQFAGMIVDQASLAIHNAFMIGEMRAKQETDADLRAAQEIQRSLIPKTIPENIKLDIAALFSPTKQIGGDYYDFIKIDDTHIGVIVADVSGKGVTGGLVMSVMRTIMRMISSNNYSPKHVLRELNHGVEIAVREKHMFITVLYSIFDTLNRKVTVCRAGHNPFIICSGGSGDIVCHKPQGIALGIIDSESFDRLTEEITVSYEPGDTIFLYTDGVVEEFDDEHNMYGEERLLEFLKKHRKESSEAVIEALKNDLEAFRGEQMQHDDIAMIQIKTY
ncbi:MAG: hypothetical protein A2268_09920 [Candidatus Raymondbacteria bacterium RifOxyA12_full_50_37]|uniref:PPM-type phosphatase domain-containing protein n=1 Tax=Candidatus Raymondbacteria bacterium RIFOXYD12_FULL_49_13 TaxID=1817890 RepID=A0A1F7F451_UNCRA|nr:MAG: hypothetical protein A2268_09920 [Candidatus Raymondbacteria bacterium RifOxyA12_full_50_37]OGJ93846.1 MAG: hypothetical protein A2248_06380 [Candidatus Raymondbacteria bacterium RIFOXYA2_FULL_49_16]OGJ97319.1 MAG: hypothetical protein A2487_16445 [Candidatus Raymondbacteria bacterium RifOxyC12_full_50_8]OGJ98286.1 MAG: hypothetical protein A2453_00790 [Candidatus Raymondbacteria bacterium RIFOXYC2_FULL_50_21]OGJ99556.1 MAG: hypothetical protein A2350_10055 [Candidatus Raymondbacteria b